ncbi:hypothetical protein [Fodinibius halophilus]|uniref:D-isomer specific 2-hydroxyacid dehydrogenase NAD-binding domain-containing protein n=1 Tax=Fodinibius halophilus TaxID=1736908 RepID=A0A6M1T119_9BACT|nr:hypothetical protein [Fodinibius halophilus]NGP89768.1 hypothetical protein [Fodinibius halophilus]
MASFYQINRICFLRNRSNIIITPHIASITQPSEVADQIVDNYKRALSGMELNHKVERQKGY